MPISASLKAFVILLIFTCTVSCQQSVAKTDVAESKSSNFAVRLEVPVGTPGSMQYSEPVEGARGIWFGEAQSFHLAYAGLSKSTSGETVIHFEVVHQEKVAFLNLTEANIGQHMAIEVDGEAICAPILNSGLPVGGIIEGAGDDWNAEAASELVYSLKTGGQKRD